MKLRSPLPPPTRANRALLPAGLAGLLALGAAAQLALTGADAQFAAPGWAGGGARADLPPIAAGEVPAVLRRASMFDPARTAGGGGDGAQAAPAGPLGGAAVAGSVRVGNRSVAIIELPGGRSGRLAIGGTLNGLRLVALDADGAVFQSGNRRIRVPYGAPPISSAPTADSEEESQ